MKITYNLLILNLPLLAIRPIRSLVLLLCSSYFLLKKVRRINSFINYPASFFNFFLTALSIIMASYTYSSFYVNSVVLVNATTNKDRIKTPQIHAENSLKFKVKLPMIQVILPRCVFGNISPYPTIMLIIYLLILTRCHSQYNNPKGIPDIIEIICRIIESNFKYSQSKS